MIHKLESLIYHGPSKPKKSLSQKATIQDHKTLKQK